MNPLNQLLVFVLVVVVALACYIYFHYIKSEPTLDPSDKDWKKYRDEVLNPHLEEDKAWAEKVADEAKVRAYNRDEELKVYFKKLWNDGGNWWELFKASVNRILEMLHVKEYWAWYAGAFLILGGLVLHYIFGV